MIMWKSSDASRKPHPKKGSHLVAEFYEKSLSRNEEHNLLTAMIHKARQYAAITEKANKDS